MARQILKKVHDLKILDQKLWNKLKAKAASEGLTIGEKLIQIIKKEVK